MLVNIWGRLSGVAAVFMCFVLLPGSFLEYPFLDTEVPVTPWDVRKFLERFYENR